MVESISNPRSYMLSIIQARELVVASDGIEQTRAFAQEYVDRAAQVRPGQAVRFRWSPMKGAR